MTVLWFYALAMGRSEHRTILKGMKWALVLFLPVFLSACLYLDIGTVLSLKRLDPYSVDLVNSRAAIVLPLGVNYAPTVKVVVRVTRDKKVLQEEIFDLDVVDDEKDLPGIELGDFPQHPLVVRLAAADYERAIALQKRLSALDKNHKWVEPGNETVRGSSGLQRDIAENEKASGDLTIDWKFYLNHEGVEKYCNQRQKIRLTGWVKLNDAPQYRRVFHGMPLKKMFAKKGMQQLCAASKGIVDNAISEIASPSD